MLGSHSFYDWGGSGIKTACADDGGQVTDMGPCRLWGLIRRGAAPFVSIFWILASPSWLPSLSHCLEPSETPHQPTTHPTHTHPIPFEGFVLFWISLILWRGKIKNMPWLPFCSMIYRKLWELWNNPGAALPAAARGWGSVLWRTVLPPFQPRFVL